MTKFERCILIIVRLQRQNNQLPDNYLYPLESTQPIERLVAQIMDDSAPYQITRGLSVFNYTLFRKEGAAH